MTRGRVKRQASRGRAWRAQVALMASVIVCSGRAYGDCISQAKTIFENLTGTLPPTEIRTVMEQFTCSGNYMEAALAAIDYKDRFYRKLRTDWHYLTNEARVERGPLNAATALWMCMVRDEIPFNEVLSGDYQCIGDVPEGKPPIPTPNLFDNSHYQAFDEAGYSYKDNLKLVSQSDSPWYQRNGFSKDTVAGTLTTQQWGQQFFLDGTNRAVLAFTFDAFLCRTIDELADNTLPKDVILGAVERAPADDPSTFVNRCSGCHAVLDAHLGATAYYDFIDNDDFGFVFDPTDKSAAGNLPQIHKDWFNKLPEGAKDVNEKINRNGFLSERDGARIMTDDTWNNSLANPLGKHVNLGWNGRQSGSGLPSWGRMLTSSDQFGRCMARRAYQSVCNVDDRQILEPASLERVTQLASQFVADNYNMKKLFGFAAVSCKGQ